MKKTTITYAFLALLFVTVTGCKKSKKIETPEKPYRSVKIEDAIQPSEEEVAMPDVSNAKF